MLQILKASANASVTLGIPGSGAVAITDKTALAQVYTSFVAANGGVSLPFNGYGSSFDISGGLMPWDQLLSNASYDPCVLRAYGVYCINGRIVWINCNSCGAAGAMPAAIGSLPALQEIDFSLGNALTGDLPCQMGNLQVLNVIVIVVQNEFAYLTFDLPDG